MFVFHFNIFFQKNRLKPKVKKKQETKKICTFAISKIQSGK